jgi:hypothetical protein
MTTACQGAEAVIHLGGIATEAPWRRIPWSSSRPRARVGGGALNQGHVTRLGRGAAGHDQLAPVLAARPGRVTSQQEAG